MRKKTTSLNARVTPNSFKIKHLQDKHNLTNEYFAELAEVSLGSIDTARSGRRKVTVATLRQIAKVLGENYEDLILEDGVQSLESIAAAPSDIRVMLDDCRNSYLERNWLDQRLQKFRRRLLENNDRGGIFLVKGPPQSGKTFWMLNLVRTNVARFHYFFDAKVSRTGTDNMVESLRAQWNSVHGKRENAPTASTLADLLTRIAPQEQTLIGIDAAEQANVSAPAFIANISSNIPKNIVLVVTTRNSPSLPRASEHVDIVDFEMEPEECGHDVKMFIESEHRRLSANRRKKARSGNISETQSVNEFLRDAASTCGINFFHVRELIADASKHGYHAYKPHWLPESVADCFQSDWDHMDALTESMRQNRQPILEWLLETGRKGQSATHIQDDTGLNCSDVKPVLNKWRGYLRCEQSEIGEQYSFSHESFRKFLAENCEKKPGVNMPPL